jgi:alpha-tubulin suppressor-like RCC1 family protein
VVDSTLYSWKVSLHIFKSLTTVHLDGKILYACGKGDRGQLGLGDRFSRTSPAFVDVPEISSKRLSIRKVAVGSAFSVLLLDNDWLLACGAGDQGQMGSNHRQDQLNFSSIYI